MKKLAFILALIPVILFSGCNKNDYKKAVIVTSEHFAYQKVHELPFYVDPCIVYCKELSAKYVYYPDRDEYIISIKYTEFNGESGVTDVIVYPLMQIVVVYWE